MPLNWVHVITDLHVVGGYGVLLHTHGGMGLMVVLVWGFLRYQAA